MTNHEEKLAKRREYYAKNREQILCRQKEYRLKTIERKREWDREWARKNYERRKHKAMEWAKRNYQNRLKQYRRKRYQDNKDYHRRYYQEHAEERKKYQQSYAALHPDKLQVKSQNYRSRKINAPLNDFTTQQWVEMKIHYGFKCAYCDRKQKALTMDHITPLSKGGSHTKSNIVPACRSCNSKKKDGAILKPIQPLLI